MGFLDKAKQLAQQAAEQAKELQRQGQLKAQQYRSSSSPPPAQPPMGAAPVGRQITNQGPEIMASSAGLPNPATLLSVEAVAQALGEAPSGPDLEPSNGAVSATWYGPSGSSMAVTLFCPTEAEGQGRVSVDYAIGRVARVRANFPEPVDIPGADEAWGSFGDDEPYILFRRAEVAGGVGASQLANVGDARSALAALTAEVVRHLAGLG